MAKSLGSDAWTRWIQLGRYEGLADMRRLQVGQYFHRHAGEDMPSAKTLAWARKALHERGLSFVSDRTGLRVTEGVPKEQMEKQVRSILRALRPLLK